MQIAYKSVIDVSNPDKMQNIPDDLFIRLFLYVNCNKSEHAHKTYDKLYSIIQLTLSISLNI